MEQVRRSYDPLSRPMERSERWTSLRTRKVILADSALLYSQIQMKGEQPSRHSMVLNSVVESFALKNQTLIVDAAGEEEAVVTVEIAVEENVVTATKRAMDERP